jgi:ABC transporter with metal-binding/Fe-S-binding domain ATP-binding protein
VEKFKANQGVSQMKLGVLFSGGKDSTYALYKAKQDNEIACLISIVSENKESYMFHTPNIHLVELQAESLGIPLMLSETKGIKEDELQDLKKAISDAKNKYKIQGLVTGAVASRYQAERIQKICDDLDLKCINPLWMKNQVELLQELLQNNFKVIISGVFAYPLDEKWLGKQLDKDVVQKLADLQKKFQLNPSGEGGEIETTVLDCPIFKKKIKILESESKMIDKNSGVYLIKRAKLAKKIS